MHGSIASFLRERNLYKIVARERAALLAGEARTVKRLVRAYRLAEKQILSDLNALSTQIAQAMKDGSPISKAWLQRQARYLVLLQTIGTQLGTFGEQSAALAELQKRDSIARGLASAKTYADAVKVGSGFQALNPAAFEGMVHQFASGSPLRGVFREFGAAAIRKAQDQLTTGVALGLNPREVARGLVSEIKGLSLDRAVRIARNESVRVYTTAQKASYEANSDVITASMIVSAKDSRTCLMCWGQDGTIVEHGADFYRHVGCRCALVPVPKFVDLPDREAGEVAFARLSAAEQRAILGPSRFALYEKGDLSLKDLYRESQHPLWGPELRIKPLANIKPSGGPVVPSDPTRPMGSKLTGTLVFPKTGALAERLRPALSAMERVHGPLPLPKLKVTGKRSKDSFGYLRRIRNNRTGEVKVDKLNISPGHEFQESTFAHEFGHFVDMFHTGEFKPIHESAPAEWGLFIDAVSASAEIIALLRARSTGNLVFGGSLYRLDDDYVEYLLSGVELWARAYAQFSAVRSADVAMLKQMERILGMSPNVAITQWANFEPIEKAVEACLRAIGALR